MKSTLRTLSPALAAALLLCAPFAYGQDAVQAVGEEAGVTVDELVVWLLTGVIAGSVIGWLATRKKGGLGRFKNVALGMAGAVVGGFLFDVLGIDLALGSLVIEYGDVVAALAGSLLILFLVLWLSRRMSRKPDANS